MSLGVFTGGHGGRDKILKALFGVAIGLGYWAFLNTIDPNFANIDRVCDIPTARIERSM